MTFLFFLFVVSFLYALFTMKDPSSYSYGNHDSPEIYHSVEAFKVMKYDYLHSPVWKDKRLRTLMRDKYTCQSCNQKLPLHVHHLKGYNQIPLEPVAYLISLCETCHAYQHEVYGYPKTYKDYMNWNVILLKKPNLSLSQNKILL